MAKEMILAKTSKTAKYGKKAQIPPSNRIIQFAKDGTVYLTEEEAIALHGSSTGIEIVNKEDKKRILSIVNHKEDVDDGIPETANPNAPFIKAEKKNVPVGGTKEADEENNPQGGIGEGYDDDEDDDESPEILAAKAILQDLENPKIKISELDALAEQIGATSDVYNNMKKEQKLKYLKNKVQSFVNGK